MHNPFISVIVTAHDRKNFLPNALRSLEGQVLNRSRFEVIVVKNFEDSVSDGIIDRNGWKNIVVPGQTDVIQKILIGLEEAKGEVITFLEDDDMYSSERLAYVYVSFKSIKGLVWFHNLQHYIDEEGNLISGANIRFTWEQPQYSILLRTNDTAWNNILKRYTLIHHNNSSIAVTKHVAENLKGLRGMAPDTALTLIASFEDGLMLHIAKKLTYFRVRSENIDGSKNKFLSYLLTHYTLLNKYGNQCSINAIKRRPWCILLYHHIITNVLNIHISSQGMPVSRKLSYVIKYSLSNGLWYFQIYTLKITHWRSRIINFLKFLNSSF